jgi:hypothetical protein
MKKVFHVHTSCVVGVGSLRPTLHIMRVIQGKGFNGRAPHIIYSFSIEIGTSLFLNFWWKFLPRLEII